MQQLDIFTSFFYSETLYILSQSTDSWWITLRYKSEEYIQRAGETKCVPLHAKRDSVPGFAQC